MLTRAKEVALRIFAFYKDEEGQALAEYALILGLIAVAAVAALTALGLVITGQLGSVTDAFTGSAFVPVLFIRRVPLSTPDAVLRYSLGVVPPAQRGARHELSGTQRPHRCRYHPARGRTPTLRPRADRV